MSGIIEWHPVSGCSPISTGCKNCERWTGEFRFNEALLSLPLQSTPAQFYVCPHGDLFHESIPGEWIDRVFDVMERAHWGTFQVLTKRAERMHGYVTKRGRTCERILFGVSAERQQEVDLRVPWLRQMQVSFRFLTLYPLLGRIDLCLDGINAVLAGEEPQRPAQLEWVEAIRAQCEVAGVLFHWGRRV